MESDSSDRFFELITEATVVSEEGFLSPTPRETPGQQYLLVLEADSSDVFFLPRDGAVVVGRSKEAQVRLKDRAVSRGHAQIQVVDGDASVKDLGSHNGTFVNDERVVGSRTLVSGDVITICATNLVYTSSVRPKNLYSVVDFREFRRRVEAELDRSLRQRNPFTLAVLTFGPGTVDRPAILQALESRLRMSDIVTWAAGDQLLMAMPDTGADDAPGVCARLVDLLAPVASQTRIGSAICPTDGSDFNALLAGARSATARAAAGGWADAAHAFRTLRVRDRSIIVADPAMQRLYALIERLAKSDISVLIGGETGTGKDVAASALHEWSPRSPKPFVALNCAAIQENLVESELFGHERGAFSGAVGLKIGLLEAANGGTVFLDEIGELSAPIQAKLLRVLEDRKVTRIGDVRAREVDIRIVAATNRDLEKDVEAGRFRRDLFFRLSAGKIWLPPLRDRRSELAILAQALLADACAERGHAPLSFSDAAMRVISAHTWPGNVRELKNLADWLVATVNDPVIDEGHVRERIGGSVRRPSQLPPAPGAPIAPSTVPAGGPSRAFRPIEEELRDLESRRMAEALEAARGNKTRAAELISMPLRTFMRKLEQYGLHRQGR